MKNEAVRTTTSDSRTNITSHKIIQLTDAQDLIIWMLFTEERKITCSERSGASKVCSDELNIKLQALGSFQKNFDKEAKNVMEMRGRAFSAPDGTVNFSNGYIVVEDPWKEMRIGTFMMNYLVAWAKTHYPDYQPVGISLSSNQAGKDYKERRNRFYDRFKFRFIWDDTECKEGNLDPEMRVSDLHTTDKWEERIKVFSVEEGMKGIFSESRQHRLDLRDAQHRMESAINARNRAEADAAQNRAERTRWALFGLAIGFVATLILKA